MIAILSDIHGNLEALKSVTECCISNHVNQWVVLGDLVDYGADSVEVVKLLSSFNNIKCIRGNHDDAILKEDCSRFTTSHGKLNFEITLNEINKDLSTRNLLSEMTQSGKFMTNNSDFEISMVHGSEEDLLWGKSPKVISAREVSETLGHLITYEYSKIILGGHSHISGYSKIGKDTIYINPGSVGQPRNGDPRAQFILCNDDFTMFKFCSVGYDIDRAAKKIYDSGRPKFLSTRLYLGI